MCVLAISDNLIKCTCLTQPHTHNGTSEVSASLISRTSLSPVFVHTKVHEGRRVGKSCFTHGTVMSLMDYCSSCLDTQKYLQLSLALEKTIPNRILKALTEWLPGVQLRHFSTICAVHIEDCGCLAVMAQYVADHWQLKPRALGSIPSSMPTFPTEAKCVTLVFLS